MGASPARPRRFLLIFTVAALVQFAILMAPSFRPLVDGFSGRLASASAGLIRIFGGTCVNYAAVLSTPGGKFSMEVRDGCNGVNVVILLWAAVLAYPSSIRWKLIGLAGGLAAIQGLNLFRLISLFYLGQYSTSMFEFAHLYLWETLIIIDAMVVFGIWARRLARQ
jgi:exosortase H (IPTLxxWG-CTERM-specific)